MVKETGRGAVKKDASTQKRKPGKPPRPGEVRTEKLVMRVHPDLMELLTESAREKGVTRSAYVEQLLVGWVRLDPRNCRVDMIGKYAPDAPDQKRCRLSHSMSDGAASPKRAGFCSAPGRRPIGILPRWTSLIPMILRSLRFNVGDRNLRENDFISISCGIL